MVVEPGDGRLQDVRGGCRARRFTPAPILEQQRGLRLGATEAELAGEGPAEPRRRVDLQITEALRDILLGEPRHVAGPSERILDALRDREAHGAGAVFSDR